MVSFETLLSDVVGCTKCAAYLPQGVRPLLQVHPDARILIAGQAPGRKAHQSGLLFDDASGDRLREWLGVSRDFFYDPKRFAILPMGFCYPGTGKSGDLAPRPECAPAWRDRLLAYLGSIQLTLVIGQYSQAYHLGGGQHSLTQRVKAWKTYASDVMPLPHPSPRNNIWLKRNPWFVQELVPVLQQRVSKVMADIS